MQGIAFHDQGDGPVQAVLYGVLIDAVKGDHHDLPVHDIASAFLSGRLDGFNGAQGLIVILAVDHVDVVIGLKHPGHDLPPLGLGEVARRLLPQVPAVGPGRFLQSSGPSQLGRGIQGPLDIDDVDVLRADLIGLGEFMQPFTGFPAFCQEVRPDPAGKKLRVVHRHHAVYNNDRDLRLPGLRQDRIPAGLGHRRQHDIIHILLDEGPDGCDLSGLLLLPVLEQKGITVFL